MWSARAQGTRAGRGSWVGIVYTAYDSDEKQSGGAQRRPGSCARRPDGKPATGRRRLLAPGEALFRDGDRRRAPYRVVRGALCHHIQWPGGRHETIEFAFPGEVIGLGCLERHVSTAQAVTETEVVEVDTADLDEALNSDGALAARMAAAADREFDIARERALRTGPTGLGGRLASLLLALTSEGRLTHGRDDHIAGELPLDVVAGYLQVGVDKLAQVLDELGRQGLVAREAGGLRITDRPGLARLADTGR